jgi:putative hydrolase
MMTPEQRAVLSELQALMSLAEGYCNHVMNHVGRSLMPNFDLIHARVEQRQKQRGRAEELFLRLTGLKMKMEQYRLGEMFATQVASQRGMPFLNQAWSSRENLPTEAEILEPDRWIARLERVAA